MIKLRMKREKLLWVIFFFFLLQIKQNYFLNQNPTAWRHLIKQEQKTWHDNMRQEYKNQQINTKSNIDTEDT